MRTCARASTIHILVRFQTRRERSAKRANNDCQRFCPNAITIGPSSPLHWLCKVPLRRSQARPAMYFNVSPESERQALPPFSICTVRRTYTCCCLQPMIKAKRVLSREVSVELVVTKSRYLFQFTDVKQSQLSRRNHCKKAHGNATSFNVVSSLPVPARRPHWDCPSKYADNATNI